MTRFAARFCILHIILVCGAAALWLYGVPLWPDHGTARVVAGAILAVMLWGLWRAWRQDWDAVEWIAARVVMLGLFGTVLGFIAAFQGYGGAVGDAQGAISAVAGGMAISLHATLLGIASSLWLQIVHRVARS